MDLSRLGEDKQQKRRYATPALVCYGSVSKLTQGSTGSVADGMSGSFMMMA